RYHAKDLAGGRVLLQGLDQAGVLGLELAEEARVLDGDDGLVGEGSDKVNLLVGERANLRAPHEEESDQIVLPQHGDGQHGPVTANPLRLVLLELRIGQNIDDLDRPALDGRPPTARTPAA